MAPQHPPPANFATSTVCMLSDDCIDSNEDNKKNINNIIILFCPV
jgi:hypothetical protein